MIDSPWSQTVRLGEVSRLPAGGRIERRLVADEVERAAIADLLNVEAIDALEADLTVSAWFDGVQIEGRWRADIVQICGVSLDPFPTALAGRFKVQAVPKGSDQAPREEGPEVVIDLEADDPPDVLESDVIDLAAYVVEHLALEIDPFPRKPGVEFVLPEQPRESSPFDALRALKGGKADQ